MEQWSVPMNEISLGQIMWLKKLKDILEKDAKAFPLHEGVHDHPVVIVQVHETEKATDICVVLSSTLPLNHLVG